jgi:hypothetical protein
MLLLLAMFGGWRSAFTAKRIDAVLMQLWIGNRPAFLLDALGAKARIAPQRPLVLAALAHIRRRTRVGRALPRDGRRE